METLAPRKFDTKDDNKILKEKLKKLSGLQLRLGSKMINITERNNVVQRQERCT